MQKQRIEYIDLAKGFCIILVVLVHIAAFYTYELPGGNFFKSFRMPLYFCLSGCFFKAYSGFSDFLKRRINKLLIPFIFFYIFTSIGVPHFLFHVLKCNCSVLHPNQMLTAIYNESFPNLPIWFLLCLFEDCLIFYGIYRVSLKFPKYNILFLCIGTMIMGIIGLSLGILQINLPFTLDSAFSALPFFAAGYVVFRKTNLLKTNSFDKYLVPLIIIAFFLVWMLCEYYSFLLNSFTVRAAMVVYPCGLLGTYGTVMLAKLLKHLPLISYLGRYSIMVLVTHIHVLNLYAGILKHIGLTGSYVVYLNLILTLLSYLLLIPIMQKLLPHFTAQKDLIKVG